MPRSKATQDDLNSLDDRVAIIAAVGTTPGVTPDQILDDYGDFDCDHSQATHDRCNGRASRRDSDGVGYSSIEEVETYYDNGRPSHLRLL